jgi:hypothetical protein
VCDGYNSFYSREQKVDLLLRNSFTYLSYARLQIRARIVGSDLELDRTVVLDVGETRRVVLLRPVLVQQVLRHLFHVAVADSEARDFAGDFAGCDAAVLGLSLISILCS